MIHTDPKVSVLMACFNADRFVAAALDSITAQTYSNLEIIVVDDGSTDQSGALVARHSDPRLRLFRQSNQGAAKARNAALRHATGDFVLFLDADDMICPEHVEALVKRAGEQASCIALSRWSRFRLDIAEATFPERVTEQDLSGPDWLELDWRECRPMTQSGMLLLPRDLIERNGGWDERLTLQDDFEFFARMIARSSGVRFAPAARLYYRSAIAGSLSSRKTRSAVQSAFMSVDLGTQHLLAVKDTPSTRRVCANLLKEFDYSHFPHHGDLRALANKRASALGGADLKADGPPGFRRLRPLLGWKAARLVQKAAYRFGLTGAQRKGKSSPVSGAATTDR